MKTIVYKYRLWSPTTNKEIVDDTFDKAVDYYNALVGIENRRRSSYRQKRSELFPNIADLENREKQLAEQISIARRSIKDAKSATRTRAVDDSSRTTVGTLQVALKEIRGLLRSQRSAISLVTFTQLLPKIESRRKKLTDRISDLRREASRLTDKSRLENNIRITTWYETKTTKLDKSRAIALEKIAKLQDVPDIDTEKAADLVTLSEQQHNIANQEIKDLRKTLYWGTYLLVEDAVKRAAKMSPEYLSPKTKPRHQLSGRIGTQLMGGLSVSKVTNDTRVQLLPSDRAKGLFRLRVGTVEGSRQPIWAEFPVKMHRPLPRDAKITWAVVSRRPGHLTLPWIYHLCLTVQTSIVGEQETPVAKQGTCAINFGWRQVMAEADEMHDTLRVATLNNDAGIPSHVELPIEIYRRFDKCKDLQSIVDDNFNDAKKTIGAWIAEKRSDLPPTFLESFLNLPHWRSTHRLADLVLYWRDHRLPADDDVFASAWRWRGRWFHLFEWLTCNRQKALRARLDFYRKTAQKIATSSEAVVVEDFDISQVARRPAAEEEDASWQRARENRTRASCHELRLCVVQACARYHTKVALVRANNNTRRCNACGRLLDWDPARDLVRDCPDCSTWDQDVNNTDNSHDRIARGEVATLVAPGKVEENLEISGSVTRSYRVARRDLPKEAKTREI